MAFGLDVRVEQDLFAGYFGVLVEDRRVPVVGIRYRATALDTVLLALEGAGVVPPVALAGRHRQIGLLGARLDLVEDPLPQRFEVRGRLVGVLVLGLEVRDDFGVLLVAQPFVRVDEHVAVVLTSGVDALWRPAAVRSCARTDPVAETQAGNPFVGIDITVAGGVDDVVRERWRRGGAAAVPAGGRDW